MKKKRMKKENEKEVLEPSYIDPLQNRRGPLSLVSPFLRSDNRSSLLPRLAKQSKKKQPFSTYLVLAITQGGGEADAILSEWSIP